MPSNLCVAHPRLLTRPQEEQTGLDMPVPFSQKLKPSTQPGSPPGAADSSRSSISQLAGGEKKREKNPNGFIFFFQNIKCVCFHYKMNDVVNRISLCFPMKSSWPVCRSYTRWSNDPARNCWRKSTCVEHCGLLELFPAEVANCCVDSQETVRLLGLVLA